MKANADDRVDLFIGPKATKSFKMPDVELAD
jgi:hypothetical protein